MDNSEDKGNDLAKFFEKNKEIPAISFLLSGDSAKVVKQFLGKTFCSVALMINSLQICLLICLLLKVFSVQKIEAI